MVWHSGIARTITTEPGAIGKSNLTRGGAPAAFSTRTPGAPEQAWRKPLERAPVLPALKGSILIVAPHPDDETFAAAGLMLRYPGAHVLAVSDGEAAYADPGLRCIRRQELRRSLAHARGTSVAFLRLPDGEIGKYQRRLERALQSAAQVQARQAERLQVRQCLGAKRKRGAAVRLTAVLLREDDSTLERRVCENEVSAKTYAEAMAWLRRESIHLRKVAKLLDTAGGRLAAVHTRCQGAQT